MDGILIVNKPKEFTSHDVVAKVKKITGEKIGHTGTLDPMATGVLPLLIGKATKLSKYLTNHDKIYEATLKLGIKTDTLDSEGKVIEERKVDIKILQKENIEKVFEEMLGKQEQIPPIYSAIKVKGKKLYEYAREKKQVEIPKRTIEIYEIKLINININEKTITFKVHCSKGTYIRTLCETIAQKLGTIGYMKELNRKQVGNFNLKQAVTINDIKKNNDIENNQGFWRQHLITIESFFENTPSINISDENKLNMFLNGVKLPVQKENGLYRILQNGKFIGIGVVQDEKLKRELVVTDSRLN